MEFPKVAWSTDSDGPVECIIWLTKRIASKELGAAYQENPGLTVRVFTRVVDGIHAMVRKEEDRPVWGSGFYPALDELRAALGIEVPKEGPVASFILSVILNQLLKVLIDLISEDEK